MHRGRRAGARPWAPIAAVAAELIRAECGDRHVIPLRHDAVLAGDTGIAGPDDAVLECGGPIPPL
ncbi:MAG: hypothetical protein ACR2O6_03960 [Ilumatobacteraceae bacterium]